PCTDTLLCAQAQQAVDSATAATTRLFMGGSLLKARWNAERPLAARPNDGQVALARVHRHEAYRLENSAHPIKKHH
ncbi:MAG: hypothetical protein ACT6SC_21200, partial [Blastomonas fulva]